jgi:hypothetical protein
MFDDYISKMKNKNAYEDKYFTVIDDKTLLNECLNDIKKYRKLSPDVLCAINQFSYQDRLRVLTAYNEVIDVLQCSLFNVHS